jgi:hypothetical protein
VNICFIYSSVNQRRRCFPRCHHHRSSPGHRSALEVPPAARTVHRQTASAPRGVVAGTLRLSPGLLRPSPEWVSLTAPRCAARPPRAVSDRHPIAPDRLRPSPDRLRPSRRHRRPSLHHLPRLSAAPGLPRRPPRRRKGAIICF